MYRNCRTIQTKMRMPKEIAAAIATTAQSVCSLPRNDPSPPTSSGPGTPGPGVP
jgi:hypothetical protein